MGRQELFPQSALPEARAQITPEKIGSQDLLVMIVGPTGVGKDETLNKIRFPHQRIVTYTTRYQGTREIDGKDYYFTSPNFFEAMIERRKIYEHYQNPRGDYYGTSKIEISNKRNGDLTLWRLNPDGAFTIIDDPEKRKWLEPFVIICLVAPLDILEQRIIKRGRETGQLVAKRKDQARGELFLIERKTQILHENEEISLRFEPVLDEKLIFHNGHGWHDTPDSNSADRAALRIIENREGLDHPDGFPRTMRLVEETITDIRNLWRISS